MWKNSHLEKKQKNRQGLYVSISTNFIGKDLSWNQNPIT